jgi:hypothetical protein
MHRSECCVKKYQAPVVMYDAHFKIVMTKHAEQTSMKQQEGAMFLRQRLEGGGN